MSDPSGKGRPRRSSLPWRAFFRESRTPIFVLGKGKRLRFANAAWEQLTGVKLADALGLVCSTRRHSTPLAAALAPTPDALAGTPGTVRRPAPPLRTGPPWWDVSFTPLAGDDGLLGLVGSIAVVGEPVPAAARKIPANVTVLRERHAGRFTVDLLSGQSAVAERFASQVRLAAETTAPVWLVGEPGSGKETTARVIHHTGTQRERMFVALDCGGLQPYLIESLLFGHGGQGLAASDRVGTLFLKEPAALPRDMQERLLDVFLEAKPGALRLICASARRADDDVTTGRLLPDFDTTLSVLELRIPPLRDRLEDLTRIASRITPRPLEPAAVEVLKAQSWAGNLRELVEVLAEAAGDAGPITRDQLPRELRVRATLEPNPPPGPSPKLDALLEAVEKRLIRLAMAKSKGNATKAAEWLGIWRTRILRRIEALGIVKPE
ncbi:MAG TPA: sigma 54-interacting transcriptional regulator [Gemmataceae bacterium]|nr:sigma 54-interacting transcriptional regulator [Gemmataceae bacterium]